MLFQFEHDARLIILAPWVQTAVGLVSPRSSRDDSDSRNETMLIARRDIRGQFFRRERFFEAAEQAISYLSGTPSWNRRVRLGAWQGGPRTERQTF